MKICKKCGDNKENSEFNKNPRSKDKLTSYCKSCYKEYNEKYRKENTEYFSQYRKDNKESLLNYAKNYYNQNPENHKKRNYKWREKNIDRAREYMNQWKRDKRKKDPHIERWKDLLKNTLDKLKQNKINNTLTSLGYSSIVLKEHLDSLGINWEEHEVDHKIPITWFENFTSPLIVNDLRNLQPILKSINRKKSNRGSDIVEKSYYLIAIEFIKTKYKDRVKYE